MQGNIQKGNLEQKKDINGKFNFYFWKIIFLQNMYKDSMELLYIPQPVYQFIIHDYGTLERKNKRKLTYDY